MHENHLPAHLRDSEHIVVAHMLPQEVEELSRIQGGKIVDPATGYHSFIPLGHIISHEKFSPHFEMFKRETMAKGGHVGGLEDIIRKSGRYGDTEAVILPRPLAELFDHALYGGAQPGNPHTGKREYFLGGLLSSIGNFFKPVTSFLSPVISTIGKAVSPVLNTLAPALGGLAEGGVNALGSMVGMPELGSTLGGALGGTVSNLIGDITGGSGGGSPSATPGGTPTAQQAAAPQGQMSPYAQQQQQLQQTPFQGGSALDMLKYGAGQVLNRSLPELSNMANRGVSSLAGKYLPQGMAQQAGGLTQNLMQNLGGMTASPMIQGGAMPTASQYGTQAMDTGLNYGQSQLPQIQNPLLRAGAEGALNSAQNIRQGQNIQGGIDQGFANISPQTMSAAQGYTQSHIMNLLNSILGGGGAAAAPQVGLPQEQPQMAMAS